MNQVDIYINNLRLDLFQDEDITLNLSVQNVQDISKVFTDFSQGFTVPASTWNNAVLQHYYRSDITSSTATTRRQISGEELSISYAARVAMAGGTVEALSCCAEALDELGGSYQSRTIPITFDGRFRQPARIEINSLPFRFGVLEIESVQLKDMEPYAYSLMFYGELVNMTDLFGDDYLYDIDFSEYDHAYNGAAILARLQGNSFGSDLFYPLMSPVKNWYYNTDSLDNDDNNIARNFPSTTAHGVHYYELKPAVKVKLILDRIAETYGITFTGSFLTTTPFTDLALWLHRREGYMYQGQPSATQWELIDFDQTASPTPDWFNLTTDSYTPLGLNGTGDAYTIDIDINVATYTDDYFIGIFKNGILIDQKEANGSVSFGFTNVPITNNVDVITFQIRPSTNVAMDYHVTRLTVTSLSTSVTSADVSQSAPVVYAKAIVIVTEQMPEIKVKDFISGIAKKHNLVIVPTSTNTFLLQPLEDWYASGTNMDYQQLMDITDYVVKRPPLYREIEFKHQETEQILGFQYRTTNGIGFGDLRSFFTFDAEEFVVEVPFECPLFERLTNQTGAALTNVLVYKSITRDSNEAGAFNPYLGSAVLIYGYFSVSVSSNRVRFIDEVGGITDISTVWYANVSNRPTGPGTAYSLCFGSDIDPYHLQTVQRSAYATYWQNYIEDLYSKYRRLVEIEAVLPIGKIITMDLKNKILWNNERWLINSASVNMTTGRVKFQLLNEVETPAGMIGPIPE